MPWILTLVAFAGLLTACGAEPPAPVENALVIGIDTVRYDAFWLPRDAGFEDALSPWVESAERYSQARAPSPWTLPSVASVLSGRYPRSHGAGWYRDGMGALDERLPPPLSGSVRTWTSTLRGLGYQTTAFVAQAFFHPHMGLMQGFDTVAYFDDRQPIVARFGSWLESATGPGRPPFFAMLHFLEAHREHMQPRETMAESMAAMPPALRSAALAAAPGGVCVEPDDHGCISWHAYVHSVSRLRASIADVFTRLVQRDQLERTVVVLYADHGEEFFDHQREQLARGTNPRRVAGFGHGHAMYDELLRVPLLIWDPRRAGEDRAEPASLVDIAPTLAARLGLEADPQWEGRPLGSRASIASGPIFASAMATGPEETVVVRGRWKRIHRTRPEERVLYDIELDPGERRPSSNAAVAAELDTLLQRHESGSAAPPAESIEMPDRDLEALKALGYLGDAPAP